MKIRYAKLMKNDVVDTDSGICVSLWMQGCPFRCNGCHNPETWDFNGGNEIEDDVLIDMTLSALTENGIKRDLSILGGEPLVEKNLIFLGQLITDAKRLNPSIKIYLWTGFEYSHLVHVKHLYSYILSQIDVLITGPFILDQRDITLKLRGSRNQEIWRRNENGKLVLDTDNM